MNNNLVILRWEYVFAIVGSFSCSGRRSLISSCVPKSGVKIGVNLVGNRKLSRAQVFRD